MFDINFNDDNITFASIEKKDIARIQNWINSKERYYADMGKKLDLNEFYEMFLEYYIGECEFFLKIEKEEKIVGICRGRVEFLDFNKVWIGCFILDKEYSDPENKKCILKKILNYFMSTYGIYLFEAGVVKDNEKALEDWKDNGFKVARVSKNFYDINGEEKDMLVLQKNI